MVYTDTMSKRKRLVIIDGKSVFYRGYYAMGNLSTKDGTPTGGVFGFATMALEVLRKLEPDYVCVAWDKPKTNIRKRLEIYPDYKAGRKAPPPDFYAQIPILHELLEAFGWPLYELDDYEADDIMGTLAIKASAQDVETMLVTSDLDMLQMVDWHISVYVLKKGLSNIELFHPESFEEKYGIIAPQFLDLKALKGDSSDNIPGVPGVGEKTAITLLQEYKTLDGVYENINLIKESVRKKLVAGKDSAYMSKKLAAIWTDAPLEIDLAAMSGEKRDTAALRAILQRLEFRTLLRNLPEHMQNSDELKDEVTKAHNGGLHVGQMVLIDSNEKLPQLQNLNTEDEIVLHARSAGKHGAQPQVIIFADKNTTYVLDMKKIDATAISSYIKKDIRLIGYDIKNSLKTLLEIDIKLTTIAHDTLIGAFLINSLERVQSLDELASRELGMDTALDQLDSAELIEQAPKLTALIRQLAYVQGEQMSELTGLIKLAGDIEWRIIPVLAAMEYTGIQLNADYLYAMSDEFEGIISDIEQQIYGHADQEFNISSPAQLSKVLFEDLGLPTAGIKKGKTAYSTAASELDKLRWSHPIINLITQYREYTKLKSTYVDALPKMIDEHSRLHTDFRLTIAQTGRLSSAEPNLQNIPVRTEIGKKIREAFVAGEGNVLVSADYSQFELRLAAAMADDKELVELFNQDADIHTETAAQVYEVQPHEVTPEQRRHAKVINFGILYGMSTHGLSVATGMNLAEAKEFLERYKELRRPLFVYTQSLIELAKKQGYVETLFGRRRPMPDITSSNFIVRSAAERAAMNMPIQGTEADLMKMAMIQLQDELPESAKQLLQIHDSIIVECPEKDAEKIETQMVEIMENIYPQLPVKLKVDVTSGKTWGDL